MNGHENFRYHGESECIGGYFGDGDDSFLTCDRLHISKAPVWQMPEESTDPG